ncbi:MAG: hypothetical protein LBM23_10815 [Propionibacteriaceae bacterium]|jgi:hypothetical protein|nr:hypothetical protein [Propionibacteriaceae bacterium]
MTELMYGADVEQLRSLANQFESAATELEQAKISIERGVQTQFWFGPVALRFKALWEQEHSTQLVKACLQIQTASKKMHQNANEQDEASSNHDQTLTYAGKSNIPSPSPGPSPIPPTQTDGERTGRAGREENANRNRDDTGSSGNDSVPGSNPTEGGLGEGQPGVHHWDPEAPTWTPPDSGSGPYDTEWATPADYARWEAAKIGSSVKRGEWPNASRNLDHFLDNTGTDLDQDVDGMLNDVPGFNEMVTAEEDRLARLAVENARNAGASGPISYPINTPWNGYYITKEENENWFYATGGMQWNLGGTVVVYPPENGEGWRYEIQTEVNYRDRYNWDGTKETTIGPFTVSDTELQELHRAGLAREYNMNGKSSQRTTTGIIP